MKKIIISLVVGILCLPFVGNHLFAQLNEGGFPLSFQLNNLQSNIPTKSIPEISVSQLLQEDETREEEGLPFRFAFPIAVDLNLDNAGLWEDHPKDGRIWRLNIEAKNAKTINLLYSQFEIPKGAKLFIYNRDKTEVLGAFTDQNSHPSGAFATGLIHDDFITLELFEPSSAYGQTRLTVSQVGHGYRYLIQEAGIGDSGNCQVDVNCSPEGDNWQDEKKGIAGYLINGQFYCSGSLVNNSAYDCTPYFLTANHCIDGAFDAVSNPDGSAFVFLWNYEYPSCSSGTPPTNLTTAGCSIVANDSPSDFALLELTENPNDVYDVYFNGWDASGATGTGGIGIHHPAGDAKKISTHSVTPSNAGSYWELFWDPTTNGHSVTEGGSSGSPLFNLDSRVIGQLFGGSSLNCSDPANDLGRYGKVSYSWDNDGTTDDRRKLSPWLDPVGAGSTTIVDGVYDPCTNTEISFVGNAASASERNAPLGVDCLKYKEVQMVVKIGIAPSQPADITINTVGGNATEGNNADFTFSPQQFTLSAGNLQEVITINVYNDAYVEGDETIEFGYTLNSNGGDAISGNVNQTFTLTINDDDLSPGSATNSIEIFSEDFESGFGAVTTTSNATPAWLVGDNTVATSTYWNVPAGTGQFAFTNDDETSNACGQTCDRSEDRLILPSQDLSNSCYVGASLNFDVFFENNSIETGTIEVSTDNGISWTVINTLGSGSWVNNTVDLSAYIGNVDVLISFRFNDQNTWSYGIAIDNPKVVVECILNTQTDVNISQGDEQYLGPNSTVHFFDPTSGNYIASIENLSNHDYGCTTLEVIRSGTSSAPAWCDDLVEHIASKVYRASPDNNNSSGTYNITVYYTEAEIAGWELATGRNRADLHLIKTSNDLTNPQVTDVRESILGTAGMLGTEWTYTATVNTGFSDFGIGSNTSINSCSPCPTDYAGGNALINNQNIDTNYETNGVIQSTQIILTGTDVEYNSGTCIEMNAGFEVQLGAEFEAFIDGCRNLFSGEKIEQKRK